jgi:hypothetical protein
MTPSEAFARMLLAKAKADLAAAVALSEMDSMDAAKLAVDWAGVQIKD